MSAPDHARGLLLMARKDFDAIRGKIGNPLFADEVFGFHAQQAIEKSLKASLDRLAVIAEVEQLLTTVESLVA